MKYNEVLHWIIRCTVELWRMQLGRGKFQEGKMVEIFYIPKFVFVFYLNLCKHTAASENSHVSITSAKVRNIFQLK
jgi:hypothetical protein